MAQQILFRRDTAANWTSANPLLGNCEIGVETNTGLTKIGDGSSAWNSLGYSSLVMASTTVPTARLGTGAASSAVVLCGDGTWGSVTTAQLAGSSVTTAQIADGTIAVADMSAAALASRNLYLATNYQ